VISHFGSDARPAVPALLELLSPDATNPISPGLIEALCDIAPELFTNAPSR
jgi:hypothetical protein